MSFYRLSRVFFKAFLDKHHRHFDNDESWVKHSWATLVLWAFTHFLCAIEGCLIIISPGSKLRWIDSFDKISGGVKTIILRIAWPVSTISSSSSDHYWGDANFFFPLGSLISYTAFLLRRVYDFASCTRADILQKQNSNSRFFTTSTWVHDALWL